MIELGLSASDRRAFELALSSSHSMRVEIDVLDRDEKVIGPLGLSVIAGSVQVDSDADVDRALELVCLDPGARFSWAPQTPSEAGLYADNYLAVRYCVDDVPGVGTVEVPVFWGPISAVQRNEQILTVHASGKEYLMLAPHTAWTSLKIEDRTPVDDAIRRILVRAGESRINLNPQRLRLSAPVVVAGGAEPWKVASLIAANADRHLFYDGRGRARLREYPRDASYRFATGAGGNVLTPPAITYDVSAVRNAVEVLGPADKGPTPRPRVTAVARREHPLSPWALSRNGTPRYLVFRRELDKATSRSRMQSLANRELTDRLLAELAVELEALPAPHLEPMDIAALVLDGQTIPFRVRRFTLPLTSTSSMTLGTSVRTKLSRRVA